MLWSSGHDLYATDLSLPAGCWGSHPGQDKVKDILSQPVCLLPGKTEKKHLTYFSMKMMKCNVIHITGSYSVIPLAHLLILLSISKSCFQAYVMLCVSPVFTVSLQPVLGIVSEAAVRSASIKIDVFWDNPCRSAESRWSWSTNSDTRICHWAACKISK